MIFEWFFMSDFLWVILCKLFSGHFMQDFFCPFYEWFWMIFLEWICFVSDFWTIFSNLLHFLMIFRGVWGAKPPREKNHLFTAFFQDFWMIFLTVFSKFFWVIFLGGGGSDKCLFLIRMSDVWVTFVRGGGSKNPKKESDVIHFSPLRC